MSKLTRKQEWDLRAIAARRDEDIDSSNAPSVRDWSGVEIGKFNRPTRKRASQRVGRVAALSPAIKMGGLSAAAQALGNSL